MELYYGNCDSNAKMVSKIANATKVAINDFRMAKNGTTDEPERVGAERRASERGEWMERTSGKGRKERRKLRSKHAYMQRENVAKIAMVVGMCDTYI